MNTMMFIRHNSGCSGHRFRIMVAGLKWWVGSGRFAAPFGICCGIDPSRETHTDSKERGIEAVIGEGEHLPYRPGSFDYVLMMTVICFLIMP